MSSDHAGIRVFGEAHPTARSGLDYWYRAAKRATWRTFADLKLFFNTAKAIESEEEYDRMVAAVEQLMDKGEDRLSPEESALLETMAILIQAHDDRYHPLPPAPLTKCCGTS